MNSSFSLEFLSSKAKSFGPDLMEQLFTFDQLYFPYAWPLEDWNQYCSVYSYSAVLLRDKEQAVQGLLMCLGDEKDDVAHLVKIVTAPSLRKQGWASLMLNHWCESIRQAGTHKSVYLEVEKTNHSAINFYHKHHFLVLRTLRDFYGRERDAQAMVLSLDNKENT